MDWTTRVSDPHRAVWPGRLHSHRCIAELLYDNERESRTSMDEGRPMFATGLSAAAVLELWD